MNCSIYTRAQSITRRILSASLLTVMTFTIALPAQAACPYERRQTEEIAKEIADHAFKNHKGEFIKGKKIAELVYPGPTIYNKYGFAGFILDILNMTDTLKPTQDGFAYWHSATGTIVIYNRKADDCGTVFRPEDGFEYYEEFY